MKKKGKTKSLDLVSERITAFLKKRSWVFGIVLAISINGKCAYSLPHILTNVKITKPRNCKTKFIFEIMKPLLICTKKPVLCILIYIKSTCPSFSQETNKKQSGGKRHIKENF
jgi:hypothetical protein